MCKQFFLFLVLLTVTTLCGAEEAEKSKTFQEKLQSPATIEALEQNRIRQLKDLPGGVFKAPAIDELVKKIIRRF